MCAPRKDGEPLAAYCFRYFAEVVESHAGGVLALIGFVVLWWYSEKVDQQQARFDSIIEKNHEFTAKQTAAIQELTFYIKEKTIK